MYNIYIPYVTYRAFVFTGASFFFFCKFEVNYYLTTIKMGNLEFGLDKALENFIGYSMVQSELNLDIYTLRKKSPR